MKEMFCVPSGVTANSRRYRGSGNPRENRHKGAVKGWCWLFPRELGLIIGYRQHRTWHSRVVGDATENTCWPAL